MVDQDKVNRVVRGMVKEAVERYEQKKKDALPDYTLSRRAQTCLGCNHLLQDDCATSAGKAFPQCRDRNMLIDMVKKRMSVAGAG